MLDKKTNLQEYFGYYLNVLQKYDTLATTVTVRQHKCSIKTQTQ